MACISILPQRFGNEFTKKAPLLKPLQVYTADNQLIAEYGGKLSIRLNTNKFLLILFMHS